MTSLLSFRYLRRHPMRLATILGSVAAGMSLFAAVSGVETSIETSIANADPTWSADGSTVHVFGPTDRGGLTPAVVDQIRAVPGAERAVSMIRAVALVGEPGGPGSPTAAIGIECAPTAEDDLCAIARTLHGPVAPSGLVDGADGRLELRSNAATVAVTAAPELDDRGTASAVLMPLATANVLFTRGGNVDEVSVAAAAGTAPAALADRLRAALPAEATVTAVPLRMSATEIAGPQLALLNVVAGLALAVGSLLVFSATSVALATRRRDLAIWMSLGSRRRRIVGTILFESAICGGVGGLLGATIGAVVLTPALTRGFDDAINRAVGAHVAATFSPSVLLLGATIGGVVAAGGALWPALQASRVSLVDELRGRTTTGTNARGAIRGTAVCGALVAGGLYLSARGGSEGALDPWQPLAASVGLVITLTAATVGAGQVGPSLIGWFRRRLTTRHPSLWLGSAMATHNRRRTSIVIAAVSSAVGTATVLTTLLPSLEATTRETSGRQVSGRVVVSTQPILHSGAMDSRPSVNLVNALRSRPDVERVDRTMFVGVRDATVGAYAVNAQDHDPLPYDVVSGDTAVEAVGRGDAVIGTALARAAHLRPGSTLSMVTPAGPRPVTVGAIWSNPDLNGRTVTMSVTRMEELFGSQAPGAVLVTPRGITAAALATEITGEFGPDNADLQVLGPDAYVDLVTDEGVGQMRPFWTVQRLLLIVVLIATMGVFALSRLAARRELALLGAVGVDGAGFLRIAAVEALAVGIVGVVLGFGGGLVSFQALRDTAMSAVGVRPGFTVALTSPVAHGALTIALVVAGAAWPALRARRVPIAQALRSD